MKYTVEVGATTVAMQLSPSRTTTPERPASAKMSYAT